MQTKEAAVKPSKHPLIGQVVQVVLNIGEVKRGILLESSNRWTVLKCKGTHMRWYRTVIPTYNIVYTDEVLEKLTPGASTTIQ